MPIAIKKEAQSIQEAIDFFNLQSNPSGFDIDEQEEKSFMIATRENGDVGEETAGGADILNGRALGRSIMDNFTNIKANIETCDEWTMLSFKME